MGGIKKPGDIWQFLVKQILCCVQEMVSSGNIHVPKRLPIGTEARTHVHAQSHTHIHIINWNVEIWTKYVQMHRMYYKKFVRFPPGLYFSK
jgi:hypothetical protein